MPHVTAAGFPLGEAFERLPQGNKIGGTASAVVRPMQGMSRLCFFVDSIPKNQ